MSLDPSDLANHPLVVTPTPASAKAAAIKKLAAIRFGRATARTMTVGLDVTGDPTNAGSADEKLAGISVSEDAKSAFDEGARFVFCRFRGL